MSSYRTRKVLRKKYNANPFCAYCGVKCVLPTDPDLGGYICTIGNTPTFILPYPQPPNMATIEHPYTRYDSRRFTNSPEPRLLMVCYLCNNYKGIIDQAKIPVGVRHAMSHKNK